MGRGGEERERQMEGGEVKREWRRGRKKKGERKRREKGEWG